MSPKLCWYCVFWHQSFCYLIFGTFTKSVFIEPTLKDTEHMNELYLETHFYMMVFKSELIAHSMLTMMDEFVQANIFFCNCRHNLKT